jgi:predicted RNA-binding Zn-ribbon protein involved in translation (DUF1610 family)
MRFNRFEIFIVFVSCQRGIRSYLASFVCVMCGTEKVLH